MYITLQITEKVLDFSYPICAIYKLSWIFLHFSYHRHDVLNFNNSSLLELSLIRKIYWIVP